MMADAVAGGDTKKLFKMMEKGELDPNKHLPMLWDAMGKNAAPYMEQYFKSIEFARRRSIVAGEEWFKDFMDKGATQAMTDFYSTFATIMEGAKGSANLASKALSLLTLSTSAVLMGFLELKEYLSGEGREYSNLFRDMFGDFVGLSNFLKMTEFKEIGNSFSQLKEQIGEFGTALAPVVEKLKKDFGKEATGVVGGTAKFAKDVVVGAMDQTSGFLDWFKPLIKENDTFVDAGMRAWAREMSKRVTSEILTAEGIDPRTFSSEERKTMESTLYPEILKTLQKQREEMGEDWFKAFIHDVGMALTGNPVITQVESSALYLNEKLADLMNVFVEDITSGFANLHFVQQATRRRPMSLDTAKFLRDNPHLIRYELPIVQGKPFDKDVIEWNQVAEEVNKLFRSRTPDQDLSSLGSAYSSKDANKDTLNLVVDGNRPLIDLNNREYKFEVPTLPTPLLERIAGSELDIEGIRQLLPVNSPEQVYNNSNVDNSKQIQSTFNITTNISVEAANMEEISEAIVKSQNEIKHELASEISSQFSNNIL